MNNARTLDIQPQGQVVEFPKKKEAKVADFFEKGYVMFSRLYLTEVYPFLSPAAKDAYTEINMKTIGFNKKSDHISYSQLQGGKLEGTKKTSQTTIRKGIKELLDLGVISLVSENAKKGNEYQINEISLVEHFKKCSTPKNEVLQKMESKHSNNCSGSTPKNGDTIDILYRYIYIDKSIYVHFANAPLFANYLTYPIRKKEAEQKAKTEVSKKLSEMFDLFWSVYPLKKNKKKAEEKFKAINFKKHSFDLIMQSLEKHKSSFDWQKEGGKYVPHPTTWIGGERWSDEVKIYQQANNYSGKPQTSNRWNEIQELIAKEEQGNDSYGF